MAKARERDGLESFAVADDGEQRGLLLTRAHMCVVLQRALVQELVHFCGSQGMCLFACLRYSGIHTLSHRVPRLPPTLLYCQISHHPRCADASCAAFACCEAPNWVRICAKMLYMHMHAVVSW